MDIDNIEQFTLFCLPIKLIQSLQHPADLTWQEMNAIIMDENVGNISFAKDVDMRTRASRNKAIILQQLLMEYSCKIMM